MVGSDRALIGAAVQLPAPIAGPFRLPAIDARRPAYSGSFPSSMSCMIFL